MGQFDNIMSCSVGGADLTLTSYSKSVEGIYNAANVRTASKVKFQCEGEITAATAAELNTAVDAFETSCNATKDGQTFTVSMFGSQVENIVAGDCLQPPRIVYDLGESGGTVCPVTFTVEALVKANSGNSGVLGACSKVKTVYNTEGVKTTTTTGAVITSPGVSASAVVTTGVGGTGPFLPANKHVAGEVTTFTMDANEIDTEASWELTNADLVSPYPESGTSYVRDGERTITEGYDEHNRKVTTYSYDYTGEYAETFVRNQMATFRAAGGMVRASIAVTGHKTASCRGQFDVLTVRDSATPYLLELTESISHTSSSAYLRAILCPGVTPLICKDAPPAFIYEQAGRAIAIGHYAKPPNKKFSTDNLMEEPAVTFNRANDVEWETTWRFRFLFATVQADAFPSSRADNQGMY